MKLFHNRPVSGTTIIETTVAIGIGTAILAGLTTASIAFQRSFVAIEDYAKGQNDQMRISDYLALDFRRALSVTVTGSSDAPPVTVTMTIPNFYQPDDPNDSKKKSLPYDPRVTGVTSWPYKKHHHHKHQNIILNQVVDYGPYSGGVVTTPTKQVQYIFDNQTYRLYRCVDGAVPGPPNQPDPKGVTTLASDVKDFNVSLSDNDETAQTSITFQPKFRSLASADAIAGTMYFQTTMTRNTR
jgi:hypothetical protein